jgi:hypothetical protein
MIECVCVVVKRMHRAGRINSLLANGDGSDQYPGRAAADVDDNDFILIHSVQVYITQSTQYKPRPPSPTSIMRRIGNLSSQLNARPSPISLTWSQIELLNSLQLGTRYGPTTFDLVSSSVLHPIVEGHTGHDTESQTGESDIDGTSFLVLGLLGGGETGHQLRRSFRW